MRQINIEGEIRGWLKNGATIERYGKYPSIEEDDENCDVAFNIMDDHEKDIYRFIDFYCGAGEDMKYVFGISFVWDTSDGKGRWEYSQELTPKEYVDYLHLAMTLAGAKE